MLQYRSRSCRPRPADRSPAAPRAPGARAPSPIHSSPLASPPAARAHRIAGASRPEPCIGRAADTLGHVRRLMLSVALAPLILLVSACGTGTPTAAAKTVVRPLPAGRLPSPIALMVCRPKALGNLGQGAFRTSSGDVVVRKDWKVLLVDVSGLPSQFGVPPTSATDVAFTLADLILGCWAGD